MKVKKPRKQEPTKILHWKKDSKKREGLNRSLADFIWTEYVQHMIDWVSCSSEAERTDYIAGLTTEKALDLRIRTIRLVDTLRQIEQLGAGRSGHPNDDTTPRGFALWLPNISRQLGTLSCNLTGRKLCREASFNPTKGDRLLAAIASKLDKAEAK